GRLRADVPRPGVPPAPLARRGGRVRPDRRPALLQPQPRAPPVLRVGAPGALLCRAEGGSPPGPVPTRPLLPPCGRPGVLAVAAPAPAPAALRLPALHPPPQSHQSGLCRPLSPGHPPRLGGGGPPRG